MPPRNSGFESVVRFHSKRPHFLKIGLFVYVNSTQSPRLIVCSCAGGFFQDAPDADYALAITDGAFTKALVIQLVRKVSVLNAWCIIHVALLDFAWKDFTQHVLHDRTISTSERGSGSGKRSTHQLLYSTECASAAQVEGEQFVGAIAEALEPRMRLTGEMATLEKFNVRPLRCCSMSSWQKPSVAPLLYPFDRHLEVTLSGHEAHTAHLRRYWMECCTCLTRGRLWCLQTFFQSKQTLEKGTLITLLWRPEGVLEILLRQSDEGLDYARVRSCCMASAAPSWVCSACPEAEHDTRFGSVVNGLHSVGAGPAR